MKHISVLIKPISSLCNLRCSYCFYANISSLREVRSFGKMTKEVTGKMIRNIYLDLDEDDEVTFAFQGGEPTMAGLTYFRDFIDTVKAQAKKVKVHYSIQTNGTIVNEKWCAFFKQNEFLVGLSIDGQAHQHDLNRVDPKGKGTFQRVLQTKELFDEYEIEYNILCVLTNSLAKDAKNVFRFIQEQKIAYIQFIPCLADLDAEENSIYALTPEGFASFYHQLFCCWLDELENGNYISIKLFDDLINLLVKRQVTACGILGNCRVQYVIEADGSVYPCDFYVLDEYRMGYIQKQTLKELFEQEVSKEFLCNRLSLPDKCYDCTFKPICGGGCKRMKDVMYVDEGYCGYAELLKEFIPKIDRILTLVQKSQIG